MRESALVIGGSGGLGAATCRAFASAGWDVTFTYQSSKDRADALAQELSTKGVNVRAVRLQLDSSGDVTAAVTDILAKQDHLSAAVYAAGPDLNQRYVSEIADDEWRRTIDIDVNGFFSLTKAVLAVFRKQRGGVLVAITTAAVRHSPPRDSLSAVPKAAIEQLTLAIAREEGRFGIRANCVAPGLINAGLGARMIEQELPSKVIEGIRASIPLKRFGDPDEIAQAVLFLASKQASYISGQILNVDGAWLT